MGSKKIKNRSIKKRYIIKKN